MLEWIQPKADAEITARKEIEYTRAALRRYPFWWIVPGIPGLYFIYRLEPDRFWFSALGMGTLALFLFWPLHQTLRDLQRIVQTRYQIGDKGLGISGTLRCRWRLITSYRLVDHPSISGLRCLEYRTIFRYRGWWSWSFDPSEVNESLLRSILEEHLPGKCLDNMPEGSD